MPILPYPSVWTLRVPKGSALTHVELDDNQIYLNKKINDTIGQNIGSGVGVYFNKYINPDDGQLLFKSFVGVSGVSVTDSISAITISSSGNYCDLADGIQVQKVRSCDCEQFQILGDCGCGTIGLRADGVTFNPNSVNSYRFPCYDGPSGYILKTDGAGVLSWAAGGGTGSTSGDTFISNVTLTSGDTICITRSDGYVWCLSLSAVTPYEYGEGFHSIQPRKDINYTKATSSNIGGGSGNTVYETAVFSNIGGGLENEIYTEKSFIGGGDSNLIHALPTIITGSTSATTHWSGQTYSGVTFSACTGGTYSAATYVTTAHTGTSFTEYAYSAVTFNSNHSSIVGGKYNKIFGPQAFIGGGEYNEIYSFEKVLFGGTVTGQPTYLYAVYSAFTYTGTTPAAPAWPIGCSGETYTGITYTGITDTGYTKTILVYSGVTYKTSYSAIVGGARNTIHSLWSTIGGGSGNTITTASTKSIIVGGHGNKLNETQLANIVGGAFNLIESPTEGFTGTTYNNKLSSIVGGYKNQLFSTLTFIGGGSGNTITSASTSSIIIGGENNLISGGTHSVIVAGTYNENLGADHSVIVGGLENVTDTEADYTFIGSGRSNRVLGPTGDYSNIVGGYTNLMTASTYSNIVGGTSNQVKRTIAGSIVGGYINLIFDADYSIIGGGQSNTIEDSGGNVYSTIVGGYTNIITGSTHSIIGGGTEHSIVGNSNFSSIFGGLQNVIDGVTTGSFIGGGGFGKVNDQSNQSSIVGGYANQILYSSSRSFIGGGYQNLISDLSNASNIVGGSGSTITGSSFSSIGGGLFGEIESSDYSNIGGGRNNNIIKALYNIIGGGDDNKILGNGIGTGWDVIVGGKGNIIGKLGNDTNNYNFIGGGISNMLSASTHATIVGGDTNYLTYSNWSHISGGYGHTISASTHAFIGGGKNNRLTSTHYGTINGGLNNLLEQSEASSIGGGKFGGIQTSTLSHIGGGYLNRITSASTNSSIVGGSSNMVTGSTNSFIGGGLENKVISGALGDTVVGGESNMIATSTGRNTIGGGSTNLITGYHNNFIGGGNLNQVRGSAQSTIAAGNQNKIYSTQSYNSILGGTSNQIGHNLTATGYPHNDQQSSVIVGGQSNKIFTQAYSFKFQSLNFIGGGQGNTLTGTTGAVTVGGELNKQYDGLRSFIGAGEYNYITGSTDSVVVGGSHNTLSGATISFIGGGYLNRILGRGTGNPGGANYGVSGYSNSSIVSGVKNTIFQGSTSEGGASILNGAENTILNGHEYSVIMGGKGLTSDKSYTTFMNGLNVDTNAADGNQKSFKYHGTFANPGPIPGKVLMDVTGVGDGQWTPLPLIPSIIGDCPVVSAWTVGCTLYMFTSGSTSGCTGTTVTADTCANFMGPYRWKGGIDSISTTLPLFSQPFENIVTAGANYSNIQGGLGNLIDDAHFAGILNGSGNTINQKAIYSAVIGTRDRTAFNPETTYTRGIDANTDGVDGANRYFKYHGTAANQGLNRFLKDVTGGGDAQWVDLPIIPTGGDCPVVSAWTQGCILYMFTSGSTSGCTGTTITANTCDNITGPYMWKGGDKSISTTLPLFTDPFENIVTPGSRYSNIQGGLKNLINNAHFGGILNGSGNTILEKAIYSAVIGTRDRVAFNPETTYTRGIDANTDGVDGVNRHFRYHGTVAAPAAGKILTSINSFGDAVWGDGGISLTGDCTIVSAFTSGCTLYMVSNCSGDTGILIGGNMAFTADTCAFGTGPYVFKGGNGSISTRLPGVGALGENYVNPSSHYSNIDGGYDNQINVASVGMSGIFSGQKNIIGASSSANTEYIGWNMIGSGYQNEIHGHDTFAKFIGAGRHNLITGSTDSIIGAGYKNRIEKGTTASGIFTGVYNKILTKTIGVDSVYSAIVNGSGNTINGSAASSAIIGADARTATQSQTTYVRGLDALTDSTDGDRKFKYHGTWANTGLNYILTDVDGLGNAQWKRNTSPGGEWTGDCVVVSAYTSGCTLYMLTNCTGATAGSIIINGNIAYTADTCNTFNTGPYRFGTGVNSIEPILNNNFADGFHANITGGLNNRVTAEGRWNTVVGGIDNRVTGYSVSIIAQGHHNRIHGDNIFNGYSTILNGFENINRHEYSTILNGRNMVTDRDYTTFGNGLDLNTDDGAGNQQPFRYHGTFAQEGPVPGAKVLTDIDGLGNARWMPLGTIPQSSGCPITSAYTVDCTLYLINCTGGTITADTCSTFGNYSPYEFGAGLDSIKPILGSLQTSGSRASIGGGYLNHVVQSISARIGGGSYNLVSGSTSAGILAGTSNTIRNSNYSSIGGGISNTIGTDTVDSSYSFIGAGGYNNIVGSYDYNFIGAGYGNEIGKVGFSIGQGWSNIVGGYDNSIYGSYLAYASIVGGWRNEISGSSNTFIGGGQLNVIHDGSGTLNFSSIVGGDSNKTDNSRYSFIGGGKDNNLRNSDNSLIGGGLYNNVNTSENSLVVGGSGNTIGIIASAKHSSIVSGTHNRIGSDGPIEYGSILNGKDNTVGHDYSVVMGSRNVSSNRKFTTFVTGLDANTVDADGNTQLFKYHGIPAAPGLGRVLTDSSGSGHAVWSRNTSPGASWSGDCVISSAWTQECILYMITNCTGNTAPGVLLINGHISYTADTCNTFNDSPYKYGQGSASIIPKLPSIFFDNFVDASSPLSNIGGGSVNSISGTSSGNIAGGVGNIINGAHCDGIGSGYFNRISLGDVLAGQYHVVGVSYIAGGYQNIISGETVSGTHFIGTGYRNQIIAGTGQFDGIMSGDRNEIISASFSTIVGGGQNRIENLSRYNSLVGGEYNLIKDSNHSSILGGSGNTINDASIVRFGGIVNGSDNFVKHSYSAVIGAEGRTTEKTHVTYTNGVDIDSDLTNGGTRYLKYHGSLANPTVAGHVLTDVDGTGNAVWAEPIGNSIALSADCVISSAYTTNCTLWAVTNCTGSTGILVNGYIAYTADTCNTFGGISPYEIRGTDSISTVIPASGSLQDNFIVPGAPWNNIQGGTHNKINQSGFGWAAIGGGYENVIGGPFVSTPYGNGAYQVIAGGFRNRIQGMDHYFDGIGGGRQNRILLSGYGFIGGGNENIITGSSRSFIGGGESNHIKLGSDYSAIGGGVVNYIVGSSNTFIGGGSYNTIYADDSVIGGGIFNTISTPIGGTTRYAGIFNGSGNTIGRNAEYAAVIGSRGINYASSPETTYMKGLDANTNGYDGTDRPFKYHGTYAQPGPNKFLKDITGAGDARWQTIPGVHTWSGDCGIISAYTTNNGCTLNLINCSGDTFTADTCTSMNGPYSYRGGNMSISTTLPSPNTLTENLINSLTSHSNIDGGLNNKIYTKGTRNSILGGYRNVIGTLINSGWTQTHHAIIGGQLNRINGNDTHYSIIGGGYNNEMYGGLYNGMFSGRANRLTGSTYSIVGGGFKNNIKTSNYSVIVGGNDNLLEVSDNTFIGGGVENEITNGGEYSSIVGGSGNTIGPITTAKWSNIQGGFNNTVGGDGSVAYASIVNGRDNRVEHDYSVVMGSKGRTSNKTHTTFVTGLDAQSNDVDGIARYFKYHGALANNGGIGKVLTDLSGTGNATWEPLPLPPNVLNITGCSIVSAYTSNLGCDLNLVDCTGGTYTIDICGTFTQGPYRFGPGINTIEPVLGGNIADGLLSNITGGLNNRTNAAGNYNTVVGGVDNIVTGHSVSLIAMGHHNRIYGDNLGQGYATILNGFENINRHVYSTILNGTGIVTTRDYTTFANGLELNTTTASGEQPFRYYGTYANEGINRILTDIDGSGNAVWMPCSTACSGATGGATGTTKHVDIRNYTANVKETISHGLVTEDVIVNVWTENKQKIEAEVFYVNANQIEIAVSMDLNNVKTVIIG